MSFFTEHTKEGREEYPAKSLNVHQRLNSPPLALARHFPPLGLICKKICNHVTKKRWALGTRMTCSLEIVMAERCSEALSREIFLHTQSTADMSYRLDTLAKPR